jgi:hypothetical protein
MKAIYIIFLSLILISCKTEPEPKGIGVDYMPKEKKVEKPPIKPEDVDKFKTYKRESDSAIYERLMDFKKDTQSGKVQIKTSKDKSAVKP